MFFVYTNEVHQEELQPEIVTLDKYWQSSSQPFPAKQTPTVFLINTPRIDDVAESITLDKYRQITSAPYNRVGVPALGITVLVPSQQPQSTGNIFAGTGENNADIGATAWVSPENIVDDNTVDSTCNAAASSQYLVARNFNFQIPGGAIIRGITVRIEASESSPGAETLNAQLQNESGTLFGSSKTASINGTGKTVYTYGGVADLWGATLTPAVVNDADFGVRFWYTTAHNMAVDYVTMAVQYGF